MPQASDELEDIIVNWFNKDKKENVSLDIECIKFLKSRGYILTRGWCWVKPVPAHTISTEEYLCMKYLVDEWDFGGIIDKLS